MSTNTFYKKVGRKYIPVSEYDSELREAFQKGSHLVIVEPGHTLTRYNIDPNYAALIAASVVAKEKMISAIMDASGLKVKQKTLTPEQSQAYIHFKKTMGDEFYSLYTDSAGNIVEAGLEVLYEEANKLLQHPTVKNAYEQFLMVAKLTKDE